MKHLLVEKPLVLRARQPDRPRSAKNSGDGRLDLRLLNMAMRRQAPIVGLFALIGLLSGLAAIMFSTPQYRAVENVLLDAQRAELLDQVSAMPSAVHSDATVQSELEIIKSESLALKVVDMLALHRDPDFMNPEAGPLAVLTDWIRATAAPMVAIFSGGQSAVESADTPRADAADILRERMDAEQVGRSFVLSISYTGPDPARAAEIARAYGDAYVQFQLTSNTLVAESIGDWSRGRLEQLEDRTFEAARAVQDFRREHGLVEVRGDLLSDQQMSELTTKLLEANAEVAEQGARLDQLENLLTGPPEGAFAAGPLLTDQASVDAIADLRSRYLDALTRHGEIVLRGDEDHPEIVRLAERMAILERAAVEHISGAVKGLRAGLEIAQSRAQSLANDLDSVSDDNAQGTTLLTRLAQLEQTAETYGDVYRDFLQRSEVAAQQQDFPVAAAQIISRAGIPEHPVWPRKGALALGGLLLGGLFGAGIGALRAMREQPLRTATEVREELGLACAGLISKSAMQGQRRRDRTLERTLEAVILAMNRETKRGKGAAVIAFAPVIPGGDDEVVRHIAAQLAMNGERVRMVTIASPRRAGGRTGTEVKAWDLEIERTSEGFELFRVPPALVEQLPWLLEQAGKNADFVLAALPPLSSSLVAERCAHQCNGAVLTLPWNKASATLVQGALDENPYFTYRLITTILTGASMRSARRYMPRDSYEAQVS